MEFREVHQKHLTEMEELRKFQSSTFDTLARRKLIEDQNTILELSGQSTRICKMKLFLWTIVRISRMLNQFAVEIHTLPVDQCHSHLIQYLKECWDILSCRRAAGKGRPAFGTHMVYRETFFANPPAYSSAPYPQELHQWNSSIEEPLYSSTVEKSESQEQKSRSEMPVWTVSQRFSHLQWRRLFKELWGRPTTTADFGSPFWQVPYASNLCLLEDKVQDRGMLFVHNFLQKRCNGSKKWSWLISVDELRSSLSTRGISMPNFEVLRCEDCFSTEQNHHNSHFKRRISLE